jgi:hypothetical protein
MKQSENISNLAKALVKAQSTMKANVVANAENASYGSRYADLGQVIAVCRDALNKEGITVIQSPTASAVLGVVNLTTRILHVSGEWLEDVFSSPLNQLDQQGQGSAISYMRRYALAAMMGLYTGDDDDAEGAKQEGFQKPEAADVAPAKPSGEPAAKPRSQKPAAADADVMKTRAAKWMGIIKSADTDQLATARANAKASFTGSFLDTILSAIATRESEIATA